MGFRALSAIFAFAVILSLPTGALAAEPAAPPCRGCECAATVPTLAVVAALPARDWKESFTSKVSLKAQGEYTGNEPWQFESFSLNLLQPSPTATVRVDPSSRGLVIHDPEPGLKQNPAAPPPWIPGAGSMSVTGWVNAKFSDVLVRGTVNVAGGKTGSESRQGVLARWDRHHSYYWFHIDFSNGRAVIGKQQPGTAAALPLPGSEVTIPGFKKTAAYRLELKVVGPHLKGRVLDSKGRLLVETPEVKDEQPHLCGISGVNAEISQNAPFAPLRASFAAVSAEAIPEAKVTGGTPP
jgi:hypothetical protein